MFGVASAPVPWQQLSQPALRHTGDAGDDIGEIAARLDAGELAGLDQRGDHGPVLGAAVRRGVMMPGVWAARLSSPIRFIRYSESAPSSSPIKRMVALVT